MGVCGQVPPYQGMHVKEADKHIKEDLKKRGLLLHNGMEVNWGRAYGRQMTWLL